MACHTWCYLLCKLSEKTQEEIREDCRKTIEFFANQEEGDYDSEYISFLKTIIKDKNLTQTTYFDFSLAEYLCDLTGYGGIFWHKGEWYTPIDPMILHDPFRITEFPPKDSIDWIFTDPDSLIKWLKNRSDVYYFKDDQKIQGCDSFLEEKIRSLFKEYNGLLILFG